MSRDLERQGLDVPPDRIGLTASTSDAYALLFKLLCDPGDVVLAPRPSYPLIEHLANLDGVSVEAYRLELQGGGRLIPTGSARRLALDALRRAAGSRHRDVDGVLRETTEIPRRMVAGVVSRVKIMADLDIAEKRVPQDGRVGLTVEGHAIDTRVVTMPRVDGEGIVMRILDKSQALIGLDHLGMSAGSEALFEDAFRRSYGAVLATGPTGSGKSTTLYAALNEINEPQRNIITIEDPVEYQIAGINQLQVNMKAGLSFASGLRAMLRADPDVIMVGEIRDGDTAKIAIESALTGHLVLSTLHTNDAPSAITRLTEMGIEPFLSASAIVAIVAQRLVRSLCTYCKKRTMLSVSSLEKAGFNVAFDLEAYEPMGCGRCGGSGYKGRTGLYEVMVISDEIRDLTVERGSAEDIRKVAVAQGMRPLRADGFEKVKNGITSIAEVARVT